MIVIANFEEVIQIKMSRFPAVKPPYCVAAYLVDGLLIDSGPAHVAAELTEFLKSQDLGIIVNTHYHEDHIAANALLKERKSDLKIYAHPRAVDRINKEATLYPYQEHVWGYPIPSRVEEIGDDVRTAFFCFQVVFTPGHSDDHICLFEASKGWLFTGDVFFTEHPELARPEEKQWQIITSLKKILELEPRVLFTASGSIVTEPATILKETIQYLEDLGQKVKLLSSQGFSPTQIRDNIFGGEHPLAELTQGQFSRENLIKSYRH